MKRFILSLALAAIATPLFANDGGGDGVVMPPIGELLREGYGGPVVERREFGYNLLLGAPTIMARPTQAYRDDERHRTIYYGFKSVAVNPYDATMQYAFGYPLQFFKSLMPSMPDRSSLDTMAVAVYDSAARRRETAAVTHRDTVTTVKPNP